MIGDFILLMNGKIMRILTRVYIIFRLYIYEGGPSTDNPRPYNPESNVPVIEVQELEFYFNDDMIIILEFIIDDNICFYYRIYKEVYYILY